MTIEEFMKNKLYHLDDWEFKTGNYGLSRALYRAREVCPPDEYALYQRQLLHKLAEVMIAYMEALQDDSQHVSGRGWDDLSSGREEGTGEDATPTDTGSPFGICRPSDERPTSNDAGRTETAHG